MAFHGHPRFTKDIDIFFDPSEENIERLIAALSAFAFSREDLRKELFLKRGNVITFGSEPSRVDLLNDIDGVRYADAKANAVRSAYGDVPVTFIGRDDLVRNKRATSRAQDKVDVEKLAAPA